MDFFSAFIYGVVQGLGEFLPISSSGHLVILPHILGIQDPGIFFDLMMHVGTALAVIIYFQKELFQLMGSLLQFLKNPIKWRPRLEEDFLLVNMTSATIASVIFIFLLKPISERFGRSMILVAIDLIVFGFFLWFVDKKARVNSDNNSFQKKILWKDSLFLGLMQAIAIFPGVSRSGITITAGRMLNHSKLSISRFSFLLSLPIILAGALLKTLEMVKSPLEFSAISMPVMFFGLVISFLVGILVIHFFLKLIPKISMLGFFLYRLFLGLILLYFFIV